LPTGTRLSAEASSKKRASLYVVAGESALKQHDPGGLDVLNSDVSTFGERLQSQSHTLKRALTDPHLFDGIGNWLSDEILHAAKLSPFLLTGKLSDAEIGRLHAATQQTVRLWIDKVRVEAGDKFPEKVSAFKEGMAVHGRYKQPCPVCGSPVQRIRYADNEANYCATCQTGGRVLADRSLSRLLEADWPVYLIEEEGQGVAFCQMIPTKDPDDDPTRVGHITSLHVLPHLRGHGYGRALLDHVLHEFQRRGFAEVTLWVLEENRNARRFYEKSGFCLDGGNRRYPRTTVPEVRYRIGLNRG